MKNIIKIILCSFLLIFYSCAPPFSDERADKIVVDNITRDVIKFEYQGHSYLHFGTGSWSWGVHDPNCLCLKK